MEMKDGKPAVYFKTRKEWRKWLNENGEIENFKDVEIIQKSGSIKRIVKKNVSV